MELKCDDESFSLNNKVNAEGALVQAVAATGEITQVNIASSDIHASNKRASEIRDEIGFGGVEQIP